MSVPSATLASMRLRLVHSTPAVWLHDRIPAVWLQPLTLAGSALLGVWLTVAVIGPWSSPYDPLAQGPDALLEPSLQHLFGTDDLGRDVFSRVLSGAPASILLALVPVYLALVIGGTVGALAGFFSGWLDRLIMGAAKLVVVVPAIVLAMAVAAALGPGVIHAITAVVVVSWPAHARVARSLVRSTRQSQYFSVARLLGASTGQTLIVDVLPNVLGPLLILVVLDLGNAIMLLAGLSFLGLGAQPPAPDWGAMVAGGAQHFDSWWIGVFPGLAIVLVVLAFNFLADSLREAFDPQAVSSRSRGG